MLPFHKSEEAAAAAAAVASSSSSVASSSAAAARPSSRERVGSSREYSRERREVGHQPTRHRQIKILTENSTLDLTIGNQLEVEEGVDEPQEVYRAITTNSQLFSGDNNTSANTSQIIAALYFATMKLSEQVFTGHDRHGVYVQETETPLFTANIDDVSGNNARIDEMIENLDSFTVLDDIQQADTKIYMSKNSFGRGHTSIYDAFRTGGGKAVSLLDILKVALNQLIQIRRILGPDGDIERFYQTFSGGNGSVKNKQQKTRRLHRNGHYNSRKRYD